VNLCYSMQFINSQFGFERDSASPATNLNARHCKKYIFNTVNSGRSLFSRASESYSKILNGKSIFNTVKNFRANSDFQGKRRVAQKSWMVRNIFNTVKILRGNCFSGKHKLFKNPEQWKYFQYSGFSVYWLWGNPCNLG